MFIKNANLGAIHENKLLESVKKRPNKFAKQVNESFLKFDLILFLLRDNLMGRDHHCLNFNFIIIIFDLKEYLKNLM